MIWQVEPLTSWPWPKTKHPRGSGRFSAAWSNTLVLLERELDLLGVKGAVAIRAFVTPADVRLDGMLRAHARPSEPGVAISFTSKHGPLTYPCDTYTDWQVNVRAIALSLEALRAVDRHGVGGRGEQYAGWRAIEAAPASGFANVDEALRWLTSYLERAGVEVPGDWKVLLRKASLIAHPDAKGDPEDWARVDAARQLLEDAC